MATAKVEKFEDLVAWQKARVLRRAVYRMTKTTPAARDRDFCSQIRRAAVSVMSNIAEGFERGGRAEFHQFLSTSKASCGEVRSLLYAALDEEYINDASFKSLYDQAEEVGRIIGGLRAAVARQRDARKVAPA